MFYPPPIAMSGKITKQAHVLPTSSLAIGVLLLIPPIWLTCGSIADLKKTASCATSSLDRLNEAGGYGAAYGALVGDAKDYFVLAKGVLSALPVMMLMIASFCIVAIHTSGSKLHFMSTPKRLPRWLGMVLALVLIVAYLALGSLRILIETPVLKPDLEGLEALCECVGPSIQECTNQETPVMHLAWLAQEAASGEAEAALAAAYQYGEFGRACTCLLSVREDAIQVATASFVALAAAILAVAVDTYKRRPAAFSFSRCNLAGTPVAPAPESTIKELRTSNKVQGHPATVNNSVEYIVSAVSNPVA